MNEFSLRWQNNGSEKSHTQSFWLELLHDVLGIQNPTRCIDFEKEVRLSHMSFIDAYIPSTGIIIEQKSSDVDLDKPQTQSDGTSATPFEQAKRYYDWLPKSQKGRYIIVSNFRELRVHDMESPHAQPKILSLDELSPESLAFLVKPEREIPPDEEISLKAGELAAKLYSSLLKRYTSKDSDSLRSLNIFCVRIVFILYAEKSGIFREHQFRDYLKAHENTARTSLIELFRILATPQDQRDPYTDDDLAEFPYINGGLFEDSGITIPKVDSEIVSIILNDMAKFKWNDINPAVFGALFESTLNPETRKQEGMHYTSIANIHRVIDPLFLDELTSELESILRTPLKTTKDKRERVKKLKGFQDKLASLTFLDPACGSGNFLTETYLSLRRLENRVIEALSHGQRYFVQGELSPIRVKISQFYGIEINDFAVAVARTALWIAEHQMIQETHKSADFFDDFIPLKSYSHVLKANAIRTDWAKLIPPQRLSYIMGNPPFRGARIMESDQKEDIASVFSGWGRPGDFDYVCCWYVKAFEFMKGTKIRAALVSTNSINQGDAVSMFWKRLIDDGLSIDFAHQTFRWDSETPSDKKAHVHCVIVGFSSGGVPEAKRIYSTDSEGRITARTAGHINAYLLDAPDWWVFNRTLPLCDVPAMRIGNKPIDDGNYLFTREEYEEFVRREPQSEQYFHLWYGAQEFLHNEPRMCLYLGNCSPHQIKMMPECNKRVKAVKEYRLASKSKSTQKLAETPTRFHVETFPSGSYVVVPVITSEKRGYIPMGFLDESVMCSDRLKVIPDATLYHFGVLESRIHMAWMRVTAGRLEMRYSYSVTLVYNCFVWPEADERQRRRIEGTARKILEAREAWPDSSLAELYDETLMPVELRRAHRENDEAVSEAYGFPEGFGELEIVGRLMEMYSARAGNV